LWYTGVDLSFKLGGHAFMDGDFRGPFPILYGTFEDPKIRFDQDLMEGASSKSCELIGKIVNVYMYNKYRTGHCLKPGEIIFVDNCRAVHGRSPFYPRYDGYDRFLVRCFGTLDLAKSEYARIENQRMVKAIYS